MTFQCRALAVDVMKHLESGRSQSSPEILDRDQHTKDKYEQSVGLLSAGRGMHK